MTEKKECPDNKIINPKTGRCVLKTGAIGKKLLKPKEIKVITEIIKVPTSK
jgi:hypothetical protein|tara:strand:- start:515 stop:667 length:153 start_codon:yes stop_codon:yes gene_type:complete